MWKISVERDMPFNHYCYHSQYSIRQNYHFQVISSLSPTGDNNSNQFAWNLLHFILLMIQLQPQERRQMVQCDCVVSPALPFKHRRENCMVRQYAADSEHSLTSEK